VTASLEDRALWAHAFAPRLDNGTALLFGRSVWPWLVGRGFFARNRRPNKYQLSLYRRFLELTGRLSILTPDQQREAGIEWEGVFHRFRCVVCGDRLRDEWPAKDDTCRLCARDPKWKEHT